MSNMLAKAKTTLILDQPFFAAILLGMPMTEDNSVKTLATDGTKIIYNSEFMAKLSHNETVFALGHEVLHCVFQHMTRRNSRDAKLWNIAADYVINDVLVKEKIGTPVKGALIDSNLVQQGHGTSEGVYNILAKNKQEQDEKGQGQPSPGPGEPGGPMDDVQDAAQDAAGNAAKEVEIQVKVIQAANAAKMAGKLPGALERLVKSVSKKRSDWKTILRNFLTERTKSDYSYARPKRRFLADDLYLPSLVGETLGEIVIAVDCSGSIDDSILEKFSNEIAGIMQDVAPPKIHVLYFDSEVSKHDEFSPDGDDFKIKAHGGGGTAFSPIFKFIEQKNINPKACVVLTDLDCHDFGQEPDYPVLWASTYRDKANFGTVIMIND